MAQEEVTKERNGTTLSVMFDFGGNTPSAVMKFGEATVYGKFHSKSKTELQALLARLIDSSKTSEEIEEIVSDWTPGKRVHTAPSIAAIQRRFKGLPVEERADVLARMEGAFDDDE